MGISSGGDRRGRFHHLPHIESLERPPTDFKPPSCFQLNRNSEEALPTFNRGPCELDRLGEVEVRWRLVSPLHPPDPPSGGRLAGPQEAWGVARACWSWLLRPCEVWPARDLPYPPANNLGRSTSSSATDLPATLRPLGPPATHNCAF